MSCIRLQQITAYTTCNKQCFFFFSKVTAAKQEKRMNADTTGVDATLKVYPRNFPVMLQVMMVSTWAHKIFIGKDIFHCVLMEPDHQCCKFWKAPTRSMNFFPQAVKSELCYLGSCRPVRASVQKPSSMHGWSTPADATIYQVHHILSCYKSMQWCKTRCPPDAGAAERSVW